MAPTEIPRMQLLDCNAWPAAPANDNNWGRGRGTTWNHIPALRMIGLLSYKMR